LTGVPARARNGVAFRTMTLDDLDAVAATHAAATESRPIAVLRDRDHWEFLLERAAAFFRRLDGSDLSRRFMIALDGPRPIGYVVAVSAPGEWNLRESEAYDRAPDTLARILTAAAADASSASASTVWGWIPREIWPLVPAWRLRSQPRLRAIPMIQSLDGRELPQGLSSLGGAYIPYLDQF
jgi:hypothetical protein